MKQHTEDNHQNLNMESFEESFEGNLVILCTENSAPFEDSLSASPINTQNHILLEIWNKLFLMYLIIEKVINTILVYLI